MEAIQVKVKRINLIGDNVHFVVDKELDGYTKAKDGAKTATKVNEFDIHISAFTAQVCALDDDIDTYRDVIGERFSNRDLVLIFKHAIFDIVREEYKQGAEIVNYDGTIAKKDNGDSYTHSFDGFNTTIVGFKLADERRDSIRAKLKL